MILRVTLLEPETDLSIRVYSSTISGVARLLRAPVQRHVMGPLVTKQLGSKYLFICS